jgi:hypothetical protein
MADRIADPWGERTPYGPGEPWPAAGAARCDEETAVQMQWLRTRMKQAAPQALVVAR